MKKFFALIAIATVGLFIVGCGEAPKAKIDVKKDKNKAVNVATETKPGETSTTTVENKGNGGTKVDTETKPIDEKPAAEKPADEKPAAEKPADEKPAAEKPADEKPAAEKPADEKPADAPKADEKKAEDK